MILKPVERLPSEAMGQSLPSNTNSKIIHCVIRSDSPDRGSLYVSGMKGIEKIDNIKRTFDELFSAQCEEYSDLFIRLQT